MDRGRCIWQMGNEMTLMNCGFVVLVQRRMKAPTVGKVLSYNHLKYCLWRYETVRSVYFLKREEEHRESEETIGKVWTYRRGL